MLRRFVILVLLAACFAVVPGRAASPPSIDLIAIGTVNGAYEDFATQTAGPLESGLPGNRLGGMGSGLAYLGGDFFLGLPDRGPNATPYDDCAGNALDDTTSFIPRFHTIHMSLSPSDPGASLPFTLTPMVVGTTLLSSRTPLVYGAGCGTADSGVPALNAIDHTNYFSGRSDNFDPTKNSLNPNNARFDPESIRSSNNWRHVYMSDEYGPYVYEFDRETGKRTRVFTLPSTFALPAGFSSAHGNNEIPPPDGTGPDISILTTGRIANKGMEGLAITPDGKTLVGSMQTPLIQDGGNKLVAGQFARIVTIDIKTGATHEYAYPLDGSVKTTISDIVAINDHEFLVDERDGKGLGDGSTAVFKKIYKINLSGAQDVSAVKGQAALESKKLSKSLFLDIVDVLANYHGILATAIPAKLEGIAIGQDLQIGGQLKHTLFVANDNDFLATVGGVQNPNQFFVFAFDEAALEGSELVPQQFKNDDQDEN